MKYTKEERLAIGRRIYEGELTRFHASEEYNIDINTARDYMRLYRDANRLPPKSLITRQASADQNGLRPASMKDWMALSKEELIDRIIVMRINEMRLKSIMYGEENGRRQGLHSLKEQEYIIIDELSAEFPIHLLCKKMNANKSGFYAWKKRKLSRDSALPPVSEQG